MSWLEAISKQKPLTVVFSEVEWADPSSLHLVKTSSTLLEHLPILFILLYRDDPASLLNAAFASMRETLGDLTEDITLLPLEPMQSAQLIDLLIGPDVLPAETRDLLIKNSEGNPSYIVEILRSLIERGILIQNCSASAWCLDRPVNSSDLQGNLNRLLQARIDRLVPGERLVLQIAAVIGPVFWSNVLQSVIGDQLLVKDA